LNVLSSGKNPGVRRQYWPVAGEPESPSIGASFLCNAGILLLVGSVQFFLLHKPVDQPIDGEFPTVVEVRFTFRLFFRMAIR
jgi:hypothetical protein